MFGASCSSITIWYTDRGPLKKIARETSGCATSPIVPGLWNETFLKKFHAIGDTHERLDALAPAPSPQARNFPSGITRRDQSVIGLEGNGESSVTPLVGCLILSRCNLNAQHLLSLDLIG